MNAVKRVYLKQLIEAAYQMAFSLSNKEEEELTGQEERLLNAVTHCSEFNISSESVNDVGRTVAVFTNTSHVGNYEYYEIFGKRDLVSNGTVIELNSKKYVVLSVVLKSDKQITLEVKKNDSKKDCL
ncbi:hypothetical protein C0R09_06980 [Brevibacillus laterosporus]|uniref:hypothetical protein n=1 Tax=Brevibacillus laterosporus TaxID=1465 RepID=UPI000C792CE8|nr:hypothetical protein [Brevibacillus laterosporus]AUM64294.1 hypothetical protein C0R09_06980 [Brevibacillus laterosporus]